MASQFITAAAAKQLIGVNNIALLARNGASPKAESVS
jgi:hypothetical protein